ncbi:hypothetical protein NQ314_002031 [Rhamnusium bicolor]|uniref:Uncharacterized protein n=1 Tax=Rhamnusium bicolor TaxID=1586634 RepID=A0AAV8ZQH3_9CUCU|nr:hypothetical protein NQ314_002031 [Rhamnusium bicolor]
MGQQIDGTWKNGKLKNYVFRFADGLEYNSPWKFQSEVLDGLHAAGEEYLTNEQPTKTMNEGCYDTVDGFFDPHTKCVYKDEYIFEKYCT